LTRRPRGTILEVKAGWGTTVQGDISEENFQMNMKVTFHLMLSIIRIILYYYAENIKIKK